MTGKIGIELHGYEVFVTHFPDRKKPYLAVILPETNAVYGVASFVSEEMADWFLAQMTNMFKGASDDRERSQG